MNALVEDGVETKSKIASEQNHHDEDTPFVAALTGPKRSLVK